MIGRLIIGAVIGVVLGVALSAVLVKGLGLVGFGALGAILAYALAAIVGALTGMFAGKPIWAPGGQIEAGLKAFFGALLAAGAMFALRTWVHMDVDLSRFGAGAGPIGDVPAAALPLIAGVLGALFGLDNTPGDDDAKSGAAPKRVRVDKGAASAKGARAAGAGAEAAESEDDEDLASRRARR